MEGGPSKAGEETARAGVVSAVVIATQAHRPAQALPISTFVFSPQVSSRAEAQQQLRRSGLHTRPSHIHETRARPNAPVKRTRVIRKTSVARR
jgi:hypothetical protein